MKSIKANIKTNWNFEFHEKIYDRTKIDAFSEFVTSRGIGRNIIPNHKFINMTYTWLILWRADFICLYCCSKIALSSIFFSGKALIGVSLKNARRGRDFNVIRDLSVARTCDLWPKCIFVLRIIWINILECFSAGISNTCYLALDLKIVGYLQIHIHNNYFVELTLDW